MLKSLTYTSLLFVGLIGFILFNLFSSAGKHIETGSENVELKCENTAIKNENNQLKAENTQLKSNIDELQTKLTTDTVTPPKIFIAPNPKPEYEPYVLYTE